MKDKFSVADDPLLVTKSKNGDLKSFEALVKKYQQPLLRKAKIILKDDEFAKDAVQDTFVKAYKNLFKFDEKKPFRPWIYKIMTNTAYDIIKKEKKLVALSDNVPTSEESMLEKLIRIEEIKRLIRALSKLPEMYEKPLREFYIENMSYAKIATAMNLPINTIRTRIHRGKHYLKMKLL
ncbi:MAG: RNA polymerase sigma factor [Patescibacteria group bacterium]|nr:RNA polymerase sigma factor [Patescibacteria group bacterium]